jgi:glycosyltransferase involved in cell wall biosynthesis
VNLYTAHGFYFHDDQRWIAREATIGLEALLARITDHTLSQSSEDAELMTSRHFVPSSAINVIGNGIDTQRFNPRLRAERLDLESRLKLKPNKFRVVSTGRVVRAKGFTDLLEAFAQLHQRHSDAELLIIGGNLRIDIEPYQAEFMARARQLGVSDAVVVTGLVERVEDYLATSDVFVLASYREGMPRAMLEAMSMELPVVVTDIRGCRQLVKTGVNGTLFPPHDHVRLGSILLELHGNGAMRKSLGEAGRRTVLDGFDECDYVARQVEAINQLVHPLSSVVRSEPSGSGVASFSP